MPGTPNGHRASLSHRLSPVRQQMCVRYRHEHEHRKPVLFLTIIYIATEYRYPSAPRTPSSVLATCYGGRDEANSDTTSCTHASATVSRETLYRLYREQLMLHVQQRMQDAQIKEAGMTPVESEKTTRPTQIKVAQGHHKRRQSMISLHAALHSWRLSPSEAAKRPSTLKTSLRLGGGRVPAAALPRTATVARAGEAAAFGGLHEHLDRLTLLQQQVSQHLDDLPHLVAPVIQPIAAAVITAAPWGGIQHPSSIRHRWPSPFIHR